MVFWVVGSCQGFVPRARPIKLATVLGALSGNSSHFISPAVVWMMAVGCGAGAAAFLAGAFFGVVLGAVWPEAAGPKHSKIEAKMSPLRRAAWARFVVRKRVTIISP